MVEPHLASEAQILDLDGLKVLAGFDERHLYLDADPL